MSDGNVVLFGEALLRLSPKNHLRFDQADSYDLVYAGSELNVAASLARFGLSTQFVTRIPDNAIADSLLHYIHSHQVGTRHVQRGGERLGVYFIEMGAGQRSSQVVYDRKFSAMANLDPDSFDWDKILDGASWFHWSGITPGISQSAADACLRAVQKAKEKGIRVSTDFNYRKNLWNYGVKPGVVMAPMIEATDLAIIGSYACQQYFDISPSPDEDESASLAGQIQTLFPGLQHIAVTNREAVSATEFKWSASLFSRNDRYDSKVYQIREVVDRIGAGDSFAAGLIYGFAQAMSQQKTIEFATAASCLKHTIFGDVNLVSVQEVEDLMSGGHIGVKR